MAETAEVERLKREMMTETVEVERLKTVMMAKTAEAERQEEKIKELSAEEERQNLRIIEQTEKLIALKKVNTENEEKIKELHEKMSGTYWHRLKDVWRFEPELFEECFKRGLDLRRSHRVELYQEVHDYLMNDGVSVESLLNDPNAHNAFAEDIGQQRCIIGNGFCLSRQHAFPKDENENKWWWPMFQLVAGYGDLTCSCFNQNALNKFAAMATNNIIFPFGGLEVYNNLVDGIVCTIPIYQSLEEMAQWQYKTGFKMLIVCDQSYIYKFFAFVDKKSFPQLEIASASEVRKATHVVGEMMKILAESLVVNWDGLSQIFDDDCDCENKNRLSTMRQILIENNNNKVEIPVYNLTDDEAPKLFTIDFSVLFENDEEGAKYIPDPLLVLIKGAVNLSCFVNQERGIKDCKLLTPFLPLEEDASDYDDISLLERAALLSSSPGIIIGREINVQADGNDEEAGNEGQTKETDDSASVVSDFTD